MRQIFALQSAKPTCQSADSVWFKVRTLLFCLWPRDSRGATNFTRKLLFFPRHQAV